ncbi:MAG TPA: Fic family protein [Rhizomicrobium sp.]|nr:Fic family protein [Rhizomicrobium sp.]
MYDAIADPYCYAGTTVLKNIPGIRDQAGLDEFEAVMTAQRSDEPLPAGRLSIAHYCAIHRHLFQDIYVWAGRFRTVRIGKDGSAFCYPEHVAREMRSVFRRLARKRYLQGVDRKIFAAEAASFLSTLNAIHPFREGNGRTQTTFLVLLAHRAGHPLDLDRLEAQAFLNAMVASFKGDERLLVQQLLLLTGPGMN